jgi:TPR repeat protein
MKLTFKHAVAAIFLILNVASPVAGQSDDSVDILRKWADQGDAKSELTLGLMYGNGAEVPQDYVEAAKWLRKAADHGVDQCLTRPRSKGQRGHFFRKS